MSDVALKSALDDLKTTFEAEFKRRDEEVWSEIEKHGTASVEAVKGLERVQDGLDAIESDMAKLKHAMEVAATKDAKGEAREKAYAELNEFVRKGMLVGDDTTGGYLARPEFIADIIEAQVEISEMRPHARVRKTSSNELQQPKRTGRVSAAWGGETHVWDESQGAFGLERIPNHELHALVKISNWDLEDPYINLDSDMTADMAQQFGVAEGAAFFVGTGHEQPQGILVNTNVERVMSGHASQLTADGVLDTKYALKSAYTGRARWMLNRTTIRDLRKLKDLEGRYIWQPGLATAAPATIDGDPYSEIPDMPTVQAGALVMAYGDFYEAYTIVDRIEMQLLRDPYTAPGFVKISARRRVGGQVVLPEAIKVMQIGT